MKSNLFLSVLNMFFFQFFRLRSLCYWIYLCSIVQMFLKVNLCSIMHMFWKVSCFFFQTSPFLHSFTSSSHLCSFICCVKREMSCTFAGSPFFHSREIFDVDVSEVSLMNDSENFGLVQHFGVNPKHSMSVYNNGFETVSKPFGSHGNPPLLLEMDEHPLYWASSLPETVKTASSKGRSYRNNGLLMGF
ncbi:hypothetical protein DFS34DRAFT_638251 [Phlyctochytrium arcticum]|nr:hypothetical protein DFS34DRAFT_638251 [Phlyctochytrium arcticum]